MAEAATTIRIQQNARMRALVIPREHGAWGLMLVPLVAGACIGMPRGHGLTDFVLFLIAVLSLFMLRTPVESYFGMGPMRANSVEERRHVLQAIALVAPISIASIGALLWDGRNTGLLVLACITGMTFAGQAVLKLFGRKMRMISQIVGSIGLTSTAAGAYYVVTGNLDARAVAVWFACFLFAGDQIHYVSVRMRNTRTIGASKRFEAARNFLIGQVAMIAALAVASRLMPLPLLAIAAFAPVVLRGVFWLVDEDASTDVHWLGITELLHGITFGVLLTSTFLLHR